MLPTVLDGGLCKAAERRRQMNEVGVVPTSPAHRSNPIRLGSTTSQVNFDPQHKHTPTRSVATPTSVC